MARYPNVFKCIQKESIEVASIEANTMATNSTLGSQMTLVEDHSRNNLENLTELQNSINAQKMNNSQNFTI